MKTIDRNVTTHGHIHVLEIKDSAFANIFYEMGSIVRLPRNINETYGNWTQADRLKTVNDTASITFINQAGQDISLYSVTNPD